MELQDLQKTLNKMTDTELMEKLKEIRANRRIPRDKVSQAKGKTHDKAIKLDAMLASISKEDIAKLITALGGKK